MAFLVTVKINAVAFQTQESLVSVSLPFSSTSKYNDLLGVSKCQSCWVQTLPSGREDARHVSLSFRLALKDLLLVAGLSACPSLMSLARDSYSGG